MRHGRAKAARRTLQFFQRTTGIRPPYHVLLDGTFLVAIVKFNIPLRDRLDKVLQHEKFSLFTTDGCIEELEKLKEAAPEKEKQELLKEVIQWARQECEIFRDIPEFGKEISDMLDSKYPGIEDSLSPAGHDVLKLALAPPSSKKSYFFVASQDETILDVLRRTGKVPLLRLARGSVLLLENPSKAGQMQATIDERKKWGAYGSVREEEKLLVNIVKREERSKEDQPHTQQRRKKRKAKEPNPLSNKKPKKDEKSDSKRKRRRKRKASEPESS